MRFIEDNADEISERKRILENQKFKYKRYHLDEDGVVTYPQGGYFTRETCLLCLENLKFGERGQIEALKALELIYLYENPELLFDPEMKATLF